MPRQSYKIYDDPQSEVRIIQCDFCNSTIKITMEMMRYVANPVEMQRELFDQHKCNQYNGYYERVIWQATTDNRTTPFYQEFAATTMSSPIDMTVSSYMSKSMMRAMEKSVFETWDESRLVPQPKAEIEYPSETSEGLVLAPRRVVSLE